MTLTARGAPVTLNDGKRRTVGPFTINRLADLEDEIGTIVEVEVALRRGSLKMLRKVLQVGLDDDLTEAEVGDLLPGADVQALFEAVSKALNDALDTPKEKGKMNGKVPPRGDGEATAASPSPISSPEPAPTG